MASATRYYSVVLILLFRLFLPLFVSLKNLYFIILEQNYMQIARASLANILLSNV